MANKKVRCHYCVMAGDPCGDCQNRQKQLDQQEQIEAAKPKPKPPAAGLPDGKYHCGVCGESYTANENCACKTRDE